MRNILLFLALSIASISYASSIIDPKEIGPEAPHMLDPEAIYTTCSVDKYEISLEAESDDSKSQSTIFPLENKGGIKTVKCFMKNHIIESQFSNAGNEGSGTCGGAKFVQTTLLIDSKRVLYSAFANYCTESGISGIQIKSRNNKMYDSIVVCGYWKISNKIDKSGTDEIDSKTYRCSNFNLEELIQNNLFISNDHASIHKNP